MWTIEELEEAIENNMGYCESCEAWTADSGVEPDAEKYECPECGKYTLYGSMHLLGM